MQKQTEIPKEYFKENHFELAIYGIEICKSAKTYADFCDSMKEMELAFIESLKL